jgi:hypothetical protein
MNGKAARDLVRVYIAALMLDEDLTPQGAAGFLITQFGVKDSVSRIERAGLHLVTSYWNDVHKILVTIFNGD